MRRGHQGGEEDDGRSVDLKAGGNSLRESVFLPEVCYWMRMILPVVPRLIVNPQMNPHLAGPEDRVVLMLS